MRRRRLPITLYLGGAGDGVRRRGPAVVRVDPISAERAAPHEPTRAPGTPGFLLGTDRAGRDVVTELMLGARNSLYVSVVSTIVALITGAAIGLAIAGTAGSVRGPLTRFVDAGAARHPHRAGPRREARPGIRTATPRSSSGRFQWRLASRSALPVKSSLDFVEAAYGYGRSRRYVLVRHVLPNISPLLIVLGSVMLAAAILIEAALAFLGVGVQPPASSWGRFLSETQSLLDAARISCSSPAWRSS